MSEGTPIIIKKKKMASHAHHGGSWKVAYADFVTAMMAFFMVMWIMGMSEQTKSMVQGYFNDPNGFMKNPPKTRTPFAIPGSPGWRQAQNNNQNEAVSKAETEAAKKVEASIEQAITSDPTLKGLFKNMDISISEEGLRIEFMEASGSVFFESGKAAIRPDAKHLVDKVAPLLAKSGRSMIIEGHTDAMPYAGEGYDNLDLSSDRALMMKRALHAGGVPTKMFSQVRGYGATKLRRPDKPLDFSNRRVTVLIPYKIVGDNNIELPADSIKAHVQSVFRRPVEVAPASPNIKGD